MSVDVMSFVVYVIHACSHKWGSTPSETYRRLKGAGCIDNLLVKHYDILHTQSTGYVVSNVEDYLTARGASA